MSANCSLLEFMIQRRDNLSCKQRFTWYLFKFSFGFVSGLEKRKHSCWENMAVNNTSKVADPAAELIKDVRALSTSGSTRLTPFDHVNVRALATNISDTYQIIESMASNPFVDHQDPFYRGAVQYYRAKCLRGKRCLVSYMKWRLDKTAEAWWSSRDNLMMPQLSAAEQQYVKEYNELMVEYMTSFAVPLDLRAFQLHPPMSQNISVRGLKASTFVATSGITYHIEKGESYSLPYEVAERLLQQEIVADVV